MVARPAYSEPPGNRRRSIEPNAAKCR